MADLNGMAAHAVKRVERLKRDWPIERLRALPLYSRVPTGFATLQGARAPLRIEEIVFADPEHGWLVPQEAATPEEAAQRAVLAMAGGADGICVVTERNFFGGDWEHLAAVRRALPQAFLLALDLFVDPFQLELARAHGADAVLLEPALPGAAVLARLAGELGLGAAERRDGELRRFAGEPLA